MKFFLRYRKVFLILLPFVFLSLTRPSEAYSSTLYEQSLRMLEKNLQEALPDDFTFIVLGDSRDNDEVFKKILSYAALFKPLFILHGGDTVNTGSEKRFSHFLDIIEHAIPDVPIFVVMGNHDLTYNIKNDEGEKIFREKIAPLNYVLNMKKIDMKIIALDNSLYELTTAQLNYLEEQLTTKKKNKFVFMHVPPQTQKWQHSRCFSKGAERLMQIMGEKKVTAAFFSHLHLYAEDEIQGVKYFITGGAGAPLHDKIAFGEPTNHFIVVRIKDGNATTEVFRINDLSGEEATSPVW